RSVVVGDFNRDGKLDLAVANENSNSVSILLWEISCNCFVAVPSIANVGSGPRLIAAGDFDRDGNLDLAVANFISNDVSILKGAGNGGFTQISPRNSVGSGP